MRTFFKPTFTPSPSTPEPPDIQSLITTLSLQPHIEGGYFVETDRDPSTIPTPFGLELSSTHKLAPQRSGFDASIRNASTSIHYLLTPRSPQGGFHINKGRTVHTLHRGRGRYVILHPEKNEGERIETFIVGNDVEKGERLQWVVEGNTPKASFLLVDKDGEGSGGLLISETVIPGFEYCDHEFLSAERLLQLVGKEKEEELNWLLSPLAWE